MSNRGIKIGLLSFLASFAVMAQPAKSGEGGHCEGMHMYGGEGWMPKSLPAQKLKELKLSAEQTRKIEQMLQQARETSQPLHVALKEAHEALRQALFQFSSNEEEVMAKLSAVSSAELELKKSHMKWLLALRQELGAEQWEKLRSEKWGKGRKGMKGKYGPWKPEAKGPAASAN